MGVDSYMSSHDVSAAGNFSVGWMPMHTDLCLGDAYEEKPEMAACAYLFAFMHGP